MAADIRRSRQRTATWSSATGVSSTSIRLRAYPTGEPSAWTTFSTARGAPQDVQAPRRTWIVAPNGCWSAPRPRRWRTATRCSCRASTSSSSMPYQTRFTFVRSWVRVPPRPPRSTPGRNHVAAARHAGSKNCRRPAQNAMRRTPIRSAEAGLVRTARGSRCQPMSKPQHESALPQAIVCLCALIIETENHRKILRGQLILLFLQVYISAQQHIIN
jgi:hypothetical protein